MAKELFEQDKDFGDLAESSHGLASESEETDFSEDEYSDDEIMPLS